MSKIHIFHQIWNFQRALVFTRSLMWTDNKDWDTDIIADLFNERDQRFIYNVRLDDLKEEDSLYYSSELSGNYTVRSAYKLLQKGNWVESNNISIWKKTLAKQGSIKSPQFMLESSFWYFTNNVATTKEICSSVGYMSYGISCRPDCRGLSCFI